MSNRPPNNDYTDVVLGYVLLIGSPIAAIWLFASCVGSWNKVQEQSDCVTRRTLQYVPQIQALEDQGRDNAARAFRNRVFDEAENFCKEKDK